MTSYDFGDVVLVHFPFSGTTTRKQRPGVIVLDIGDADLVIAPVTSKARSQPGDLPRSNLSGRGLIRPSWVRLAKAATLLKADLWFDRSAAYRPRIVNGSTRHGKLFTAVSCRSITASLARTRTADCVPASDGLCIVSKRTSAASRGRTRQLKRA